MRPDPVIVGSAGQAWAIPNRSPVPDHAACLCTYLLRAPGFHPFWDRWALSCVHLRPIEGVRPAVLNLPGASHELLIVAIDPAWNPPDEDDFGFSRGGVPFLSPIDVAQQFRVNGDRQAQELARLCVLAICRGHMSPDQDYRAAWKDTIEATADHLRRGLHLPS